jgi:23S rRNA pseudouridine1911/1915/1917 synthase
VTIPPPKETQLEAVHIDLDVLYEDEDVLVINKQPGIPVHPSPGHETDTIVNALLYYFGEMGRLSTIGGEFRPGIVHRLDKDTAGVLLIAKNDSAHDAIAKDFSERRVEKKYEAIVKGVLHPPEGFIDSPVGRSSKHRKKFTVSETGRMAVTVYSTIDSKNETTWVQLRPKTGRTHQLRVHMKHLGHPIIGDQLYSHTSHQARFIALFAKELRIKHPRTGSRLTFTAPYPPHFTELGTRFGYIIPPTT